MYEFFFIENEINLSLKTISYYWLVCEVSLGMGVATFI